MNGVWVVTGFCYGFCYEYKLLILCNVCLLCLFLRHVYNGYFGCFPKPFTNV